MKQLKVAPIAACFCVSLAQLCSAQLDTRAPARSEVALAAGFGLTAQLDATASPLQFGGNGFDLGARYARTSGRFSFVATAAGRARGLSADGATTAADERSTGGELRFALRRAFGRPDASKLAIGVDLSSALSVTSHHYNDPTHSVSDFIIGSATLGPSVGWRQPIGGGAATMNFSVPVIGFVHHPYSDARTTTSQLDAKFASASTLRGVDAGLTYAPGASRRFGVEYAYRLHVLQYADVQPVRAVTQTFSIGIVRRFGGER